MCVPIFPYAFKKQWKETSKSNACSLLGGSTNWIERLGIEVKNYPSVPCL